MSPEVEEARKDDVGVANGEGDLEECGVFSRSPSASSRIPLVEVSLENITYAPVMRAVAGGSKDSGMLGFGSSFRESMVARSRQRGGGARASLEGRKKEGKGWTRKVVLHSVSTTISPGTLSAWMGPSGSGKTSLLTVAAGLVVHGKEDLWDHGSVIRVNGQVGDLPKRLVGVVWQDDLLLSNLTVRETVRFAARLKTTTRRVTAQEVDDLVDETLEQLGLTHVADSLIGSSSGRGGKLGRGISGGERKRVAVAVELVARPSVLLLDEPTSGLDATSAQALVETLKGLATAGHAVAAVIHQPRTAIFHLFDRLLLLSKGHTVYSGNPRQVQEFLESCPSVDPLPQQTGIADWIMDVITRDEAAAVQCLARHWKETGSLVSASSSGSSELVSSSVNATTVTRRRGAQPPTAPPHDHLEKDRNYLRRVSTLADLNAEPKYKSSFTTQFLLLLQRSLKQNRGERLTLVSVLHSVFFTLLTGLIWLRLPDDTSHVFQRVSLLFFVIIAQGNSIVLTSLTTFASEQALLRRERAKKMYRVLPYFLAKTLTDMTYNVLLPTLYGCVVYWVANLRPSARHFALFVLILYLSLSTAQCMGLFLSICIPNIEIALKLAPSFVLLLMILGGFYIPLDQLNPVIRWASWLSNARYGLSAFIINEFGDRQVPCPATTVEENGECPMDGDQIMDDFGISGGVTENLWFHVGMLVLIQVALRVGAYIALRRSQ